MPNRNFFRIIHALKTKESQKNMKKILLALLLFAFIISAIPACAPSDNGDNSITTTGSTDNTTLTSSDTPTPPDTHHPFVDGGVSSVFRNYSVTEGNITALDVNLCLPVAEISDNDEIKNKLTERLDEIIADITEYISRTEEMYVESIKNGSIPLFTPSISVSFVLNDFTEKAVSLTFNIAETNAYGVTSRQSRHYNYDLDIASPITYSAFFDDTGAVTRLICQECAKKDGLFPNYEALISSFAESRWYMDNQNIVFSFNPYDIAPASYGYVTLTFTAEELLPYMSAYGRDLLGVG